MTKKRLLTAATLLVLAGPLFFVKTNRDFIDLQPTEGTASSIILKSTENYEQTFAADRATITQVGLFIRPTVQNLPAGNIAVRVLRDSTLIAESNLPTVFIDTEGASYVRFDPPIQTKLKETLRIQISAPPQLDGSIRLQQRMPDETFDAATVRFMINGEPQSSPLAYQVYYQYRPPLALQLAGLLIIMAQQRLLPSPILYSAEAAFLFVVPHVLLGQFPLLTFAYAAYALAGMLMLLRTTGLTGFPALAGAHVFAFTTWLPLHILGGRSYYALAALLPYTAVLARKDGITGRKRRMIFAAAAIYALVVFTVADVKPYSLPTFGAAHPRDVFIDPNQVPTSYKTFFYPSYGTFPAQVEQWDHYGSYIGIINATLALVGIAWQGLRDRALLMTGIFGALISLTPPLTSILARILPLPPQHFVILTTFVLAFFTAWGLQAVRTYLGNSTAATVIATLITYIALLDLWHVAATTLEFNMIA